MPNIFKRPMFKLGGTPNSDGVGITSGMQRRNYDNGSNMEMFNKSMRESIDSLQNLGKKDKYDMAMTFSDVVGQGGSIHDMIMNANEIVRPQYQDYKKIQSQLGPMKTNLYKMGAELDIAKMTASKETATQTRLRAGQLANQIANQYGGLSSLETKAAANDAKAIQDLATYKLNERISNAKYMDERTVRANALKFVQDIYKDEKEILMTTLADENSDAYKLLKKAEDYIRNTSSYAEGGRVGYNMGMGPVMDDNIQMSEQIDTPQGDMSMTEDVNIMEQDPMAAGAGSAGAEDPYTLLRARLPEEITDDVVRLIAYNPEAFKDFAAIETQEDVINFNKMYQVELVIPAEVQQV